MKFIYFLSVLLFFANNACAKMEYSVTIPVDVEAENSVIAKDKAMVDAQRKAFLEIAGLLVSDEHKQKLELLTDDEIAHFVQSVSVADEKAGGTKYIANLTVQIKEELLRDYLAENEMIQTESSEVLVIPIFKMRDDEYPLLWEESNIWRKNWYAKGLIKFGTMQIKTVYDSLRDIVDFNAQNAIYMGNELYNQIVSKANTEKVYVVYAQILPNDDLKITVKNEKNQAEDNFTVYNSGEDNIFDKAIEKSVMFISNMERDIRSNEGNISFNNVNVVYMYQNMKDWLTKSRLIEALPQVEGVDTKSFGGGKVNFSIRYTGSLDTLWVDMQNLGISHEAASNYFIIR